MFSGSTCAHEMNISSTAKVLPRTPADVNSALSVVFIGCASLDKVPKMDMLFVRKKKVIAFLLFFKAVQCGI